MHMPTNPSCLVHPPSIHSHRFFTEKLRKKVPEGGNQVAYTYSYISQILISSYPEKISNMSRLETIFWQCTANYSHLPQYGLICLHSCILHNIGQPIWSGPLYLLYCTVYSVHIYQEYENFKLHALLTKNLSRSDNADPYYYASK